MKLISTGGLFWPGSIRQKMACSPGGNAVASLQSTRIDGIPKEKECPSERMVRDCFILSEKANECV